MSTRCEHCGDSTWQGVCETVPEELAEAVRAYLHSNPLASVIPTPERGKLIEALEHYDRMEQDPQPRV